MAFAALLLVLLGPAALDAASLAWRKSGGCKIWAVVDGDTVKIHCPGDGLPYRRGRILGYDTPEFKARCPSEFFKSVAATYYLRWMLWTSTEAVARPKGTDKYDRTLIRLFLDGQDPGRTLVNAGLARWYDGGRRKSWCGADA